MPRSRRDDPPLRYEWERVIKAVRLPPPVKHVALTLATYTDGEGAEAFPGVERLVDDTCTSDSTVRRALARLRELGLIVRTAEGSRNGRRALADTYRLAIPPNLLEWVELVRSPVTQTGVPGRDHRSQGTVIGRDHRSQGPGSPVTQTGSPVTQTRNTGHTDTPPDHYQPMYQPMTNPSGPVVEVRTDRARAVNGTPRRTRP